MFSQSHFYYVTITRLQVSIVGGAFNLGVWLKPGWLQYRIVVGGIQMAEILMQKLPDVFHVHFRREGDVLLYCTPLICNVDRCDAFHE